MDTINYIVIAETETDGFVLDILANLDEAKRFGEQVFNVSYLFYDEVAIKNSPLIQVITTYTFKEQFIESKNAVWSCTNGFFSVNIIETTPSFMLSKYILERSQIQSAFIEEEDFEKKCKLEDEMKMDFGKWLNG